MTWLITIVLLIIMLVALGWDPDTSEYVDDDEDLEDYIEEQNE